MRRRFALLLAWGALGAAGTAQGHDAPSLPAAPAGLPARGLRVVDGAGRPLPDVEVVEVAPGEDGLPWHDADRPSRARSDAAGIVEALPPTGPTGRPYLRRDGHVLTPVPDTLPALVTLVRAAPLEGEVVRADGSAPRRAAVLATALEGGAPSHLVPLGEDGRFRVPWTPSGRWRLTLLRPDAVRASLGTVTGGVPLPRTVLAAGALVRGRVQDGDAHGPAAGLVLRWHRLESTSAAQGGPAPGDALAEVPCDAQGRFAVADVPPGLYTVSLADRRFAWDGDAPRFEVVRPRPQRIETWWVRRRGGVRGIVRDARTRTPIPGAAVRVVAPPDALEVEGGRAPEEPARTAGDGSFQVDGVAPDAAYRIVVEAPGYAPQVSEPFDVLGGRTTPAGLLLLLRAWRLTATVVGPGDEPLAGADVLASPVTRPAPAPGDAVASVFARTARTDAGGVANLVDLPSADLRLEVAAEGFVPAVVLVPEPAPGGVREARVRLGRTLAVEGRVEATTGALPAVVVRARPRDGGPTRQAVPRPGGAFRVGDLLPSPVDLDVVLADGPPGLVLVRREAVIPGAGDEVVLPVPPLLRVEGRVEEVAAGGPAVAVRLEVERWDPARERYAPAIASEVRLPVGAGTLPFAFAAVPPGSYRLRAVQGGRDSGAVPVDVSESQRAGFALRLPLGASIEGSVHDARRFVPALGATVRLVRLDGEEEAPASSAGGLSVLTDADGRYRFGDLAPGLWRVEATDRDAVASPVVVRLTEGASARAPDLGLTGGGRIEGRVRSSSDRPLGGVVVRIARRPDLAEAGAARTDDEGRFRTAPLPAGVYRLRVVGGLAAEGALEADVEVEEGETTTVAWAPRDRGRIDGTVRRRGTAVAGVTVELARRGGAGVDRVVERTRSDAAGGFAFEGLGEGPYELGLVDGAVRARTGLDLGRGERLTRDLELGEGRISGLVRTAVGEPIPGAEVVARPRGAAADGSAPDLARVRSGPDGRFVVAGLPLGAYRLVVSPPGRVSRVLAEVIADLPGSERLVEVTFGAGAVLEVEVRDRSGAGIGAAEVWIEDASGVALHPRPFATPASGRVRVEGVPEGDVRVAVLARGYGAPRPVSVRARERLATSVRFALAAPGTLELQVTSRGDPVGRARVDVLREPGAEPVLVRRPLRTAGEARERYGETTSRGSLTVEDLEEGDYTIVVTAGAAREPVRQRVTVRAGGVTTARIALP